MKAVTMVFTLVLLAITSSAYAGVPVTQVPEPSSLVLLGSGLATWLWIRVR